MWIGRSRRAGRLWKRSTTRQCWRMPPWSRRRRWRCTATEKWKRGRQRRIRREQEAVAAAVGVKKEDVTVHMTLLGGAFGRKSFPDFIVEAAVLSKKTGKPVKVVW